MAFAEFPSLPSPGDYYEGALIVDEKFRYMGGVENFLANYKRQSFTAPASDYLSSAISLGKLVEAVDRQEDPGEYYKGVTAEAVIDGAIIALMVAQQVHGKAVPVLGSFDQLSLMPRDDEVDTALRVVENVFNYWSRGEDILGQDTLEVYEKWGEQVVPQVSKRQFIKLGAAVASIGAFEIHDAAKAQADIGDALIKDNNDENAWDDAMPELIEKVKGQKSLGQDGS